VSEAVTSEGSQTQTIEVRRERRLLGFWRRFRRNRLAVFGLFIVAVLILTAIFAPVIAPSNPNAQNYALTLQPPGEGGLMGTDSLGSDVFSRVVYGSRISIESALISVGLALLVGLPVGLVSGYFRGFWDEWVVMRVVDSIQAFPFLILALVIAAILGGGLGFAMIAIGIGFVPAFVRITRAQVLTVRGLDYVEAARAIGTDNDPARSAKLVAAAPGADDARDGLRHHRRGHPVVPGARGRARGAELGLDALSGPILPDVGMVDGVLPRYCDLLRRPWLQPPGRRCPRSPRSTNLRLERNRPGKHSRHLLDLRLRP
jgi:hypothetical protein